MIFRLILIAVLGGALAAGMAQATQVPVPNADEERKLAEAAEKKGDFESALLHYETILDSTKTDQLTRVKLRTKIGELRPKVAPNTDPSKASVWKCRAFVIRTLDYKWKDKDGKDHHIIHTFTDKEIEGFRQAMKGFQDLVWDYTSGNLRIEWDLTVLERTLTNLVDDGPWGHCPYAEVVMPLVTDQLKFGECDTVMVYVKTWLGKDEKGENLPCGFLADCTGVLSNTKGASYIVFNGGGTACGEPSGEVQLHEWLHAAEMSLGWVHGYPKDGPTDWTSDGCDYEISSGCYKTQPGDEGWMPVYKHQMMEHVTRRMWREIPIYRKSDNPWLNDYVRDFLVLGTFPGAKKEQNGIEYPFIDETSVTPKLGTKINRKEWKLASAPGTFPNFCNIVGAAKPGDVCYAAFAVESDKDQVAVIKTKRNGGCKIWQDGKLILDSPWNRTWDTDPNTVDVNLKKGKNVFLVKLDDIVCDWAFNVKVTGLDNSSLKDVRFVLP